ncbi:MAG: trk system potassium uptake protein TrkA [Candidatus Tokpelaia sp. JSC189]|nr:MAG: trk system potassium uptake protein TrkA [Candidatus Tokpelaia sp. JSC189]
MRVIICGAGQVGYGIAERLVAEQVDVTVIDQNPELIDIIHDTLDVRGLVGHGSHPDMLTAAGAAEADMIIAVTLYDEINMIACQVAHSLFNVPTKIARVRSQSYLDLRYQPLFSRDNLPIDMVISPEIEVGEMVLRRIAKPGALDILVAADGNITVFAIECLDNCPVLNTPLRQLTSLFPDLLVTVVGIKRGQQLFIPNANDALQAGDIAYITAATSQVHRTFILFGYEEPDTKRIIIAGGGNIGLYVARAIEKRDYRVNVKIIESNRKRALFITDYLEQTPVLHGSALDQAILQEALAEDTDLMIALTNQEQVNVLSAMMAKRLGCKANMILVNNPLYEEFTKTNGVDAHINPRNVVVSKILQQVRRGRIRVVHSIAHGQAEIIEGQALETSLLVGKPVSELRLHEKLRLGSIYRNGEIIRPVGATCIQPGDSVVIFALIEAVHDVEQMFRVSLDFF